MENTINKIKVRNMRSPNGNDVPNQFMIDEGNKVYFQSYNSIIAMIDYDNGKAYLDRRYWDYSVTTGKYRNQFLGENKAETQRKIDSGEYILADLN